MMKDTSEEGERSGTSTTINTAGNNMCSGQMKSYISKTSHSLDGITGLPVQAILKTTVEGAAASQDYLNSLYESGLTGKATLEYTGDMNKDLKEKLVQAFEEFGSGAKNAGKIIPGSTWDEADAVGY